GSCWRWPPAKTAWTSTSSPGSPAPPASKRPRPRRSGRRPGSALAACPRWGTRSPCRCLSTRPCCGTRSSTRRPAPRTRCSPSAPTRWCEPRRASWEISPRRNLHATCVAVHGRRRPPVAVSSEVLLTIVIPPLLFEGALRLSTAHLRAYGLLIGLLAIPGTLVAAVGIGWAAAAAGVPPQAAMLLGVIAAAIDPVSVIALVREAGLDPRLAAILEGEAVLNDGVAIVLFTIVSGPAAGGFWP